MLRLFRRKPTIQPSRLFAHGEDTAVARLSSDTDLVALDEWFGHPREATSTRPNQFLGVSVKRRRLKIASVVLLIILATFFSKAGQLQIIRGEEYRAMAEGNRVRVEMVPSLRGVIYDRNHTLLAQNAPMFRLTSIDADLPPTPEERTALWERVSTTTGVPLAELLSHAADGQSHPKEPVVLIEDLAYNVALLLLLDAKNYPGLTVESSTLRSYITNQIPTLSHILGYTGRISEKEYNDPTHAGYRLIDDIGKSGVEKTYEAALRGTYGRQAVEVDAMGRSVNIVAKEDPVNGANLDLSIDAGLTAEIEKVLEEKIGPSGRAAVVVVDPSNGELLALVSSPSFDANSFSGGIDQATYQALLDDPNNPMFDRSISGAVPSGSTFKPIVASAALDEGLINRETSFLSVGGLQVGPYFFKDWKAGGHGITNVTRALAESINTFFYYIGGGYGGFTGLGVEKIISYAGRFGFGAPLGIDLPGETGGLLPNKAWKEETKGERWYIGDTYNLAIGQGDLLVTPLQIAMMTSVFANGGILYQPHVVHALEQADKTTKVIEPIVVNSQVVSEDAVEIVRQGLRQTVTDGSARSLQSLPVTAAGKTGTAQWSNSHPTHAWFTGFAPYENPQVAITVFVEEGGGGDVIAVPIARDVLQWWFTNHPVAATDAQP